MKYGISAAMLLSGTVVPALAQAQTVHCAFIGSHRNSQVSITLDQPVGTGMNLMITGYAVIRTVSNNHEVDQLRPINLVRPWPGGASFVFKERELAGEAEALGIQYPAISLSKCTASFSYPPSLVGYPATGGSAPRPPGGGHPLPLPK